MPHDEPPLFVDLDGTLVATDLLHENFVQAFKRAPWIVLSCAFWLLSGRARLKSEIAARAPIDAATLPYRSEVLAFLREERARGRRLILATASWHTQAQAVANHLGLFDEVLATTGSHNLKGEAKAGLLVERCGEGGFDYLGNSRADVAVWRRARRAYVVDVGGRIAKSLPAGVEVARVLSGAPGASRWRPALRAMRPHQWTKNLLVFVPLLAAHRVDDLHAIWAALLAFAVFCLLASSAYVLNDLLDLEADRAHPRKRFRPLASGELSIPAGFVLSAAALAGGLALAAFMPAPFQSVLATYLALTVAYSFGMKRAAFVDVICLAALYVLRILAGGYAVDAPASFWLLVFAMFLFFSLALVKRHAELASLAVEGGGQAPGRGYAVQDAPVTLALGASSAVVTVLVLALYINGESARDLYLRPAVLWVLCPLLLYWISRVWLLAAKGRMHDDPILFAVRDRASYAVAALGAFIVWFAT